MNKTLSILMTLFTFTIALSITLSSVSYAQDFIEVTEALSFPVDAEIPTRDQLIKSAVEKLSFQYARELLGDNKVERNRTALVQRVFTKSDRYVPLIKLSPVEKKPEEQIVNVNLKFSIKDFRAMLTREGLLTVNEGAPLVLPMVEILDRVNAKAHRWWAAQVGPSSTFLQELYSKLTNSLKKEFSEKGLYVSDPQSQNLRLMIPEPFKGESLSKDDLLFLGEFLKSQIVISGRVSIVKKMDTANEYQAIFEIQALQSSNGRVVAEVNRRLDVFGSQYEYALQNLLQNQFVDVARELANQVQDVWQKGTLGSSTIRIVLRGDIEYKDFENFKQALSRVAEVRSFKERVFTSNQVVFEASSAVSPSELATRLQSLKLNRSFAVSDSSQEVTVRYK